MSTEPHYERFSQLMNLHQTIHHLHGIANILNWDQEVVMPQGGATQRAEQLAALKKVLHQHESDPRIGEWLAGLDLDGDWTDAQRADLREAKKAYELATKVPADLVAAIARLEVLASQSWIRARKLGDFGDFWPLLKEMLDRKREYADAIRGDRSRYDALLDQYEPGETTANVRQVFAGLRANLRKLLDQLQGSSVALDPSRLRGTFAEDRQRRFSTMVLDKMGFQLHEGRLDVSTHPFCTGTGADVRITTRYNPSNFTEALFGCMHEGGHALYEQGLNRERLGCPAGSPASLGIHESQSRMWENFIGRAMPFWEHFYPHLQSEFPQPFDAISLPEFWKLVNIVEPSYIRTEADEVTYNLHIILRFELEEKLLEGTLSVADLPDAWNEAFARDFGLTPSHLNEGCLQDIHWPAGVFGYFPTYALGNLYAAQFYDSLREALPVDDLLREGNLMPLREWLREHIHDHGLIYPAPHLCQRVTDQPLSAEPLLRYLTDKFSRVYDL